jgi:hypothetical protein
MGDGGWGVRQGPRLPDEGPFDFWRKHFQGCFMMGIVSVILDQVRYTTKHCWFTPCRFCIRIGEDQVHGRTGVKPVLKKTIA